MAPADILIRGGIELNIISIGSSHAVTSAQRISVNAESTLDEYPLNDIRKEDIMIFPGGMPGTSNLAECAPLMNRMQRHFAEGGTVAAICAAPGLVLSMLQRQGVVEDGNIITASGPGHAIAFGLKILERISGAEAASTIAKALML